MNFGAGRDNLITRQGRSRVSNGRRDGVFTGILGELDCDISGSTRRQCKAAGGDFFTATNRDAKGRFRTGITGYADRSCDLGFGQVVAWPGGDADGLVGL